MYKQKKIDMEDMLCILMLIKIFLDDPDIPPVLRCGYKCEKSATGPLNRQKLLDFISDQASVVIVKKL